MSLDEQAEAAHRWWRSLNPVKTEDGKVLPGDRAAMARLRRSSSVVEAAGEPATAKLFKALGYDRNSDDQLSRASALASVLAHVRADLRDSKSSKIALAIGAPPGSEPNDALLKPVRFRTLMAARTGDEILTSFRRVVAILDRTVNVRDLSRVILGWTDDESGDRHRTRFAFDYHGAGDYAPPSNKNTDNTIEKV
jgi:CRISPR system Cascade subunit CasB